MPIALRVARTLAGILLVLLLGALLAPVGAIHPGSAHHAAAKPVSKF